MAEPSEKPVVYLLVRGTAVNDSRLHHQALTLSAGGFQVIVLASQALDLPWVEERGGYIIKRFPYPPHYRFLRFYARLPLYTKRLVGRIVRRFRIIRNGLRRQLRIIRNKARGLLRRMWRLGVRTARRGRRALRWGLRLPWRALARLRRAALGPEDETPPLEAAGPEVEVGSNGAAAQTDGLVEPVAEAPPAVPAPAEGSALTITAPEAAPAVPVEEGPQTFWARLGAIVLAVHAFTVKLVRAPIIWWPFDRPFRMVHFIWSCYWLARRTPGAVYQGRRLESLPAAFLLSRLHKAKLVYDCSDLALVAAETNHIQGWRRRLLEKYENYLSQRSDAILVVSEPMVGYMVDMYGVKPPVVIANLPYRVDSLPEVSHLHQALELPTSAKLILYLGGIRSGRALDELIESISYLEEGYLVFLGYGSREGVQKTTRKYGVEDRVRFLPPVPPEDVVGWASGAHVGIHPMRPSCFNHEIALPNKLFQYLMAGLPAVVTRGTEMAKLVQTHGVGAICDPDDPRDMARAIREVFSSTDYEEMRRRAREAALQYYSWEVQEEKLAEVYRLMLGRQPQMEPARR